MCCTFARLNELDTHFEHTHFCINNIDSTQVVPESSDSTERSLWKICSHVGSHRQNTY